MESSRPPLSFLDGLSDRFVTTFQPPAWLVDEVQHRVLLLVNHVLMQEPQAQARLVRQKGSVVRVEWREFSLALEVTPAGLLDRLPPADAAARKPDLLLGVTETSPTTLVQTALQGDKPPIKIEGDVQLAADIGWLVDHVRWDLEEDLARMIGDAPAHTVCTVGRRAVAALRDFARGPAAKPAA